MDDTPATNDAATTNNDSNADATNAGDDGAPDETALEDTPLPFTVGQVVTYRGRRGVVTDVIERVAKDGSPTYLAAIGLFSERVDAARAEDLEI